MSPPPAPRTQDRYPLVATFALGGETFGFGAIQVQEIILVQTVTKVHGADDNIVGIINLRGRIVTVFDLALALGFAKTVACDESRIIVIPFEGETIGILIETMGDVVETGGMNLHGPPAQDGGDGMRFALQLLADEEQLITVLDLDRIVREEFLRVEGSASP